MMYNNIHSCVKFYGTFRTTRWLWGCATQDAAHLAMHSAFGTAPQSGARPFNAARLVKPGAGQPCERKTSWLCPRRGAEAPRRGP